MNLKTKSSPAPKKILIIRLSSIGDILLSTPFIRQVRYTFPQAQIDFVIKDIYKDLLIHCPHINELYCVHLNKGKEELSRLKQNLTGKKYTIVFDLHNNFRSNFLKRTIDADTVRTIQKSKIKQSLLVWFKINFYKQDIPIPARYNAVAEDFDITDDGKGLELFWDDDTTRTAEDKALSFGLESDKPIIGLAPGAGFYTKRWPAKKYKDLIDLIRKKEFQIAVFGGAEDEEIGSYLKEQCNVVNFSGQLTLLETACLIAKCKVLVSNDSGLMHMATAVQTPVVAIFGSTVKELGFFPYRAMAHVIENNDLTCRPCSHIGRRKCPREHFKCMEDITPEQVYNGLKELM